ncbi:MAG: hypothetical protein M3R02_00190 [Chloroflexota bacterium]|nr:hypothetical protein [Chloroflexota bacterium]
METLIILIFAVTNIGTLLYLDRMRRGMEKRFRTLAHDAQQIKVGNEWSKKREKRTETKLDELIRIIAASKRDKRKSREAA